MTLQTWGEREFSYNWTHYMYNKTIPNMIFITSSPSPSPSLSCFPLSLLPPPSLPSFFPFFLHLYPFPPSLPPSLPPSFLSLSTYFTTEAVSVPLWSQCRYKSLHYCLLTPLATRSKLLIIALPTVGLRVLSVETLRTKVLATERAKKVFWMPRLIQCTHATLKEKKILI